MGRLGDGGRIYVPSFNFSLSVTSATKSAAELPSSVLHQAKGELISHQRACKSYSFFVKGKLSRSF